MIKARRSIQFWAKEVARCEEELILQTTKQGTEQLEWKINAIVNLFATDAETLFTFMGEVEKAHAELRK